MALKSDAVTVYFSALAEKYKTGQAREHAYRPAFEALVHALDPSLKILNDPSRSEHGNPDFVFLRGDITTGYTETKDVGVDLDKTEKTEQMERYLGYSNLILTDYLEFRFFRNGVRYGESVRIGTVVNEALVSNDKAFDELVGALTDFLTGKPEPIRSGKRLAEIMGGKARRIRDNVLRFLEEKAEADTDLLRIFESVRKMLVHDLTADSFADMYAQTLVYGLFVARYHDETLDTFSRQEARDLVPESNPFLRQFFNHIAGPDFNKRLRYIVDELCEVFAVSNVQEIMDEYFKKSGTAVGQDPVIHFYEDFLKEYNPELRKKMGAYYTPLPVVRFIVKTVDQILKSRFDLSEGLADTAKLANGQHKVQVLDPAVGTGTFISAVIRIIYERLLEQGQKGRWAAYVHHDLLPRIHGFELMMAAYTIAHLKLSIAFKQTGFTIFNKRLGIYLTNSLEQASPQADLLSLGFAQSIAEEAKQAAVIKNDTPIMVVLGNPPYSVSSSNKGAWIQELIKAYKDGLGEKKINLDDDYIKFIRFAEHFIENNKTGVVAMITNNSFIDGVTHRQMRKHLLGTFDDIYILDLHGNSKKKEKAPDGGKDENVFDIQQGVAISIFVRDGSKKTGLAKVHHAELYGKREDKFESLETSDFATTKWNELKYAEPYYFFVPKDFGEIEDYEKGFKVDDLFESGVSGIETLKDDLVISTSKSELEQILLDIQSGDFQKYENVNGKSAVDKFRADKDLSKAQVLKILYRPLDFRYVIYTKTSGGILHRPRYDVMRHLLKPNLALGFSRTVYGDFNWQDVIATDAIAEKGFMAMRIGNAAKVYPLYLYADDGSKVPNLKKEVVAEIEKIVGKTVPENIFDYIYAVLHSQDYREKYKEFLKIDFPRVPYPSNKKQFDSLGELGKDLRELHLLESSKIASSAITYPEEGSDVVEKMSYTDSKVYINSTQYFGNVPQAAWDFYMGGYQPAQRWLKERKNKKLSSDEIKYYQKIIVALVETKRIMGEIDKIIKM